MIDPRFHLIEIHRTKLADLLRRSREAIGQMSEDDLNWRPNEASNSVANLVVHMAGNLHQRIEAGIGGAPDQRDREAEFDTSTTFTRTQLLERLEQAFGEADRIIAALTPERLSDPQQIRNRQVTVLDVLFTVATHLSEHVGQILYIAKLRRGGEYKILSIPRQAGR